MKETPHQDSFILKDAISWRHRSLRPVGERTSLWPCWIRRHLIEAGWFLPAHGVHRLLFWWS